MSVQPEADLRPDGTDPVADPAAERPPDVPDLRAGKYRQVPTRLPGGDTARSRVRVHDPARM